MGPPGREDDEHVKLVRWEREDELQELLLAQLVETLKLKGLDDENGFETSIGGTFFQGAVYFRIKTKEKQVPQRELSDGSILSPIRSGQAGVEALNRIIQSTFRGRAREWAEEPKATYARCPSHLAVRDCCGVTRSSMSSTSVGRRCGRPTVDGVDALQYVANGEIGIAVGEYKGRNSRLKSAKNLEVEFSSQPGFRYTFWKSEFGDEGEQPLELAYALTVHKTQGSEFGTTFLILPSPCRLLSPELLYTALTRQKDKIVIFHQGDVAELRKYSRTYFSETAKRITNLLAPPSPVSLDDRFLELGLIHRTLRKEAVRSKSEVAIADMLYGLGVPYVYEKELPGKDGSRRWPDFTVEDAETGTTVYWEHLGMLNDPVYAERWQRKEKWYRENGIKPFSEGGGPSGFLVTSRDEPNGGLLMPEIEKIAREVFGK